MLDLKYLLAHVDEVKTNCTNRALSQETLDDIDRILEMDAQRKELVQAVEGFRKRQKEIAQATKSEKDPDRRQELVDQGRSLKTDMSDREEGLRELEQGLKRRLARIPNLTHPDTPIGQTEEDNKILRKVGEPPQFDFVVRDHVELGKDLDLIDFEAGSKVTGNGFYYLKNDAVLLELALQQFAVRTLVERGFTPVITPDLARNQILEGIGFAPRGEETQIYSIEETDLSLVGTAEITLGGMFADEILDEASLPKKYVGISHCFRTEAGAAGRASRGLYRVHQFTKVEMFAFTTAEQSEAQHLELLEIEEQIFTALKIPYQVVDICTGDLGGPAYRKYDLEAWMPGRENGGCYGEVTSTSNCIDYQARRLNIRYRPKEGKGTQFVHTLNGTALALSRAMIVVLENNQRADGRIDVPEVLQPYVGKEIFGPQD